MGRHVPVVARTRFETRRLPDRAAGSIQTLDVHTFSTCFGSSLLTRTCISIATPLPCVFLVFLTVDGPRRHAKVRRLGGHPGGSSAVAPMMRTFVFRNAVRPPCRSLTTCSPLVSSSEEPPVDGEACPVVPGVERDDWPLEDLNGKPIEPVREIRKDVAGRVRALVRDRGWAKTG